MAPTWAAWLCDSPRHAASSPRRRRFFIADYFRRELEVMVQEGVEAAAVPYRDNAPLLALLDDRKSTRVVSCTLMEGHVFTLGKGCGDLSLRLQVAKMSLIFSSRRRLILSLILRR